MIISRTPFRISFFGGGTDFPEFYREHGGAVLLTTINKYSYISIHNIDQFFKFRFRASYAKTEPVLHPREFKHPLIRECLLHLKVTQGMEISHVSDLPARTGLGTSSSFTVGLLHALHTMRRDRVTPEDLAREAIHVERVRVGDSGGHQDQYAAAYGGFIRVDFSAHDIGVRQVTIGAARQRELEQRLTMFYLGSEQSAEKIVREQKRRTGDNTQALCEMRDMVSEAERLLNSKADLDAFGRLLDASWQLKKSLSSGISNGVIDQAYRAARRAGALGGKLLGAGGRGFLLLYAPPERRARVQHALRRLKEVSFAFSSAGSRIIFQSGD